MTPFDAMFCFDAWARPWWCLSAAFTNDNHSSDWTKFVQTVRSCLPPSSQYCIGLGCSDWKQLYRGACARPWWCLRTEIKSYKEVTETRRSNPIFSLWAFCAMESLPWQDWTQEASEEFGSDFRRKFGIGWVYDKAAVPRGRKNRADMQTAYNSIWLALDALHPTLHPEGSQLSDWPQWPAEREFHNAVPTLLSRQKPLGETVNLLYSSWVIQYCEKLWHSKAAFKQL